MIPSEERGDKTCERCGANKSVKYRYQTKDYCNECIMVIKATDIKKVED